jgi:hypothetical protein
LLLKQAVQAKAEIAHNDFETWEGVLDELSKSVHNPAGFSEIRADLARRISHDFEPLIVAVLKEDASGRGPTQGRGWAALTMLFWAELFSCIRALKEYARSNDEFMLDLVNTERETQRVEFQEKWSR